MSESRYDTWALRIHDAIEARRVTASAEAQAPEIMPVREMLLSLAAEAGEVVGAVARHVGAVELTGNERHDLLAGFLDQMLPHGEFSLLEYGYTLPSGRAPGLRFQVEVEGQNASVTVQLFEDRRRWRSDPSSRRDFEVLIRFELVGATIRWQAAPETAWAFAACTGWQAAVRETIALPFRHLYDAIASAS